MIGEGEQVHAALLEQGVNLVGIAVAFAAELADKGRGAGPRKVRVDVHVALHVFHSKSTRLLTDDSLANILKIQILNHLVTSFTVLTQL